MENNAQLQNFIRLVIAMISTYLLKDAFDPEAAYAIVEAAIALVGMIISFVSSFRNPQKRDVATIKALNGKSSNAFADVILMRKAA